MTLQKNPKKVPIPNIILRKIQNTGEKNWILTVITTVVTRSNKHKHQKMPNNNKKNKE